MNPKQTYWLVGIAFVLMAFIYFFERHQPGGAERRLAPRLLSNLQAREIDALEVTFPGTGGMTRAEQKEGEWTLVSPNYPAQQTVLDNLGLTLEQLRRLEEIPAHELLVQGAKSFGFDPPAATLRVESDTNRYTLLVGATTPLTTNVYVKLENSGQIFVTEGKLLQAMPGSTNAWRSPLLVNLDEIDFDRVQIREGNRVVEFEKDATNSLWEITRPIPARADQGQIQNLLQSLRGARVARFVADGAVNELETFGLATPAVEVSLLKQTNQLFQLEFGAAPTNAPNQIYARRVATTNVVLTDKRLAELLAQPYKSFHDPQLLSFKPEALDRIKVDSVENFTLQRNPDRSWWIVEPVKQKADEALMNYFITNLLQLRIVDFAKEVPTEQDLAEHGILNPVASYALFEQRKDPSGNLNEILFSEVAFGTNRADTIYAKRSDESPIYITLLSDMLVLPRHAFEVRGRQIWDFTPTNLVSLTISTQQQSRVILPDPQHGWSQDPIQHAAMDETLYRLGKAEAMGWVAKGGDRLERFGITANSLGLRVRFQQGGEEKEQELRFGLSYRGGIYTGTVFPGDQVPTVFLFPMGLYEQFFSHFPPP